MCLRIAAASLSVTEVFASIKGSRQFPVLDKRDFTEVGVTNYGHPQSQCRLDTLMAGSYCRKYLDDPFDNIDPMIGACVSLEGDKNNQEAMRPRCWYYPQQLFK